MIYYWRMVLCRWGFNVDYIQFIMFSDLRAILANLFLRLLPCACADTYANLRPLLLMNLSTKTIHRKIQHDRAFEYQNSNAILL